MLKPSTLSYHEFAAEYFRHYLPNPTEMATTTTTTTAATTTQPAQQGWAQPAGAVLWHYYRFTDEETGHTLSVCGRWGTEGVNPEDLFDKNHGCADHCKNCQKAR